MLLEGAKRCIGGYPKFITQGLNNDYLPLWLQEGGVNTYYVGKFLNGHATHNYRDPVAPGWTSSKYGRDMVFLFYYY